MYLNKFEKIDLDCRIKRQEAFDEVKDIEMKYSISSSESEEDNTYISYNKVIGTSLDEKLYLAFQILDYALLSAPGAPLKKALIDAGIGKDILGSYDNGIYQPIFSVIAKNAQIHFIQPDKLFFHIHIAVKIDKAVRWVVVFSMKI